MSTALAPEPAHAQNWQTGKQRRVIMTASRSQTIETDEEGFLLDPAQWDEALAEDIARRESLPMNAERWMVVNFVRRHFEQHHAVPEARVALKAMARELGPDKATRKYLQSLFPYGYGQQACKIAGMRKPRKLMLDV